MRIGRSGLRPRHQGESGCYGALDMNGPADEPAPVDMPGPADWLALDALGLPPSPDEIGPGVTSGTPLPPAPLPVLPGPHAARPSASRAVNVSNAFFKQRLLRGGGRPAALRRQCLGRRAGKALTVSTNRFLVLRCSRRASHRGALSGRYIGRPAGRHSEESPWGSVQNRPATPIRPAHTAANDPKVVATEKQLKTSGKSSCPSG